MISEKAILLLLMYVVQIGVIIYALANFRL